MCESKALENEVHYRKHVYNSRQHEELGTFQIELRGSLRGNRPCDPKFCSKITELPSFLQSEDHPS